MNKSQIGSEKMKKKLEIQGIPAAPGFAIGKAFWFHEEKLKIEKISVTDGDREIQRLEEAIQNGQRELDALMEGLAGEIGEEELAIFDAHKLILNDPDLTDMVKNSIREEKVNAEYAWEQAVKFYAGQLEAMENEYFRARAADVRDAGKRILRCLLGISKSGLEALNEPAIILARDLEPSDTANMERTKVLGFCTMEGGPTSHTAIISKALSLPAIVGAGQPLEDIKDGDELVLDGKNGLILANPDSATKQKYSEYRKAFLDNQKDEQSKAHLPALTKDGQQIEVVANIGSQKDAAEAVENGAEGVGLLRTEFLYLDRASAPTEDEQHRAYRNIFETLGERPIVVRTLDAGGDKNLPYLDLGNEANPFLGWRAIRVCLDQPEFFKIQLRALLRAGVGFDLRIMFPMIATLQELRRAKELLQEARQELQQSGKEAAEVQTGIMVEIPSVVVLADQFAKEVDFFSIGTNDLTQYSLAADRINQKVAHLADACNPAVLRQIKRVIDCAHQENIWTGLCGELAGDPEAVPVLLGLGLDEFSMSPASIPHAKEIIRKWSKSEAQKLAEKALDLDSASAVRKTVRDFMR